MHKPAIAFLLGLIPHVTSGQSVGSIGAPLVRGGSFEAGTPPILTINLENRLRRSQFQAISLSVPCISADGEMSLAILLNAPSKENENLSRINVPPDYSVGTDAIFEPRSAMTVTLPLSDHPDITACEKPTLRGAW